MTKIYLCLLTGLLSWSLNAQFPLKISENRHFLEQNNGKPFFWLGDTAWELFHRLNREEAEYYLKHRSSQGFTLVQAVILAEFDGLQQPNAYGDLPLYQQDPTRPNEAYFQHVDYIIDKAAELGMAVGLLPSWGDKVFKNIWGKGPEVFTPDNARVYGRWLGTRYKTRSNIIWILGGDRNPRPGSADAEVWRAMAAGIAEGLGGHDKALMSFHPQPNQEGAGEWFFMEEWLDINMFQNGHCRDNEHYDKIRNAYERKPAKPVIDGEPLYEDHPVCFNARDLGISNAYDVRKYAYLDLFAGAFGHTYGCHDIWQFYAPGREAVNGPNVYWQAAMDLPGAGQMKYIRRLMESRPMLERIPDQSLLVEAGTAVAERVQATRGKDYVFVYAATGKPFQLRLGIISGSILQAYWFNPRNGLAESAGTFPNKGVQQFKPPTSGYGNDWVLILDDMASAYPQP